MRRPRVNAGDLLQRLSRFGPAGRSLRLRLTAAVTVLSALGIAGVSAATFLAARAVLRDQVSVRIEAVADIKVDELNRWIDERRTDVAFAAELPELARLMSVLLEDPESPDAVVAVESQIRRFANELRFREVFLGRAEDGRVLASSEPGRRGVYELPSTYLEVGRERVTVQEVYVSPEDGTPTVTIAAPVRDASGRTLAVFAAHLDLGRLGWLIEVESGLGRGAEVYLVNEVGDFLSAARSRQEAYRRGASSTGIDHALEGRSGVGAYENYASEPVLGAYRWIPERRMALMVEVPQVVAFAPARLLALASLMAGVLGILGMAYALRILARQVTAPVEAISGAARRVARGDFEGRVPEYGDDELGILARSFNIMTARLEAVYTELEDQVERTTRAHAEAEGSRALLQSLIDNSAGLIAVSDADGHVYLWNRRFRELTGSGEGPLRAEPLERLLPNEAGGVWREARKEALEKGRAVETRFTIPTDEGVLHFVAVVFPIETRGPAEIGLIALDRSEAQRAETERTRLEHELHHAQKLESLGLLAGGVAHDFNNLLQVILGNAALAEQGVEAGEARGHLEQVQAAAVRASELTAQLLAYAGRKSLRNETVYVNKVIADLGELLQRSVPRSASLAVRLGEPAPVIDADPAQVVQVVMNLVTNAADALVDAKGRIVVGTDVVELTAPRNPGEPSVDELDDGTYARISVEDDGRGMDAEIRRLIFDPFFTTKSSGRGLGLAAVMGIARGGRGHVSVHTTAGEGTRVDVYLPAVTAPASDLAGRDPTRDAPETGALVGKVILVADDEKGIRRFITRALEKRGAGVVEALDGLDAVDRFREDADRLDIAVLDLTMPGLIGTEVLQQIRRERPDLPVILASGYDAADSAASVAEMERVVFLQKPFAIRDLVERILALLD